MSLASPEAHWQVQERAAAMSTGVCSFFGNAILRTQLMAAPSMNANERISRSNCRFLY